MSRRGVLSTKPKAVSVCLPLDMWPMADQELWERARRRDDILEDGGFGGNWAPATAEKYIINYGRWLAWLIRTEPSALEIAPLERVTRARMGAYVKHMRASLAPFSVSLTLRGIASVLWAFSESNDYYWLVRFSERLAYRAVSVRNKREMMKPTYELVALGFKLMANAAEKTRPVTSAVMFRNGLMIALLAYCPIRRGNLTNIVIGQHLMKTDVGYKLQFGAHETKQRKEFEVPMPESLTEAINNYLSIYRPILLRRPPHAGTAGNAFWVAADGGPLSHHGVYKAVRDETRKEYGRAINPHLFRDCAATTIALDDPSRIEIIEHVLSHSNPVTSARHYNQAKSIDASRRIQQHLSEMKREMKRQHAR